MRRIRMGVIGGGAHTNEDSEMTPKELLSLAQRGGVIFSLFPSGRLRITGDMEQVERFLPIAGQYQRELIAEPHAAQNRRF